MKSKSKSVKDIASKTLVIGHSPDADDAFMFYAIAKKKVGMPGYKIDHDMKDIQTLNKMAFKSALPVTAISAAVYPKIASKYQIMDCGASVGRKYGPIILAPKTFKGENLKGKKVGIPGVYTTSFMLTQIYHKGFIPVFLDFDRVIEEIKKGSVDAGVIIHEGQITFKDTGLKKIADLGDEWFADTNLPIPLGLDVVRRSEGASLVKGMTRMLRESIIYARAHEDDAIKYAMQFGRGIDTETCRKFVRMYVNDDTVSLGVEGKLALKALYTRAAAGGLIDKVPPLDILKA